MNTKLIDLNIASPVESLINTGIFPSQIIHKMIENREIEATVNIASDQVQPASIDLRFGNFAYPVDASFLPGRNLTVLEKMKMLDEDFDKFKIPLQESGTVLEKNRIYVVPLMEAIKLKSEVAAFANPKSSAGRLDILTRLIGNNSDVFDQVEGGYKGQLYVEVVPTSFSVVVRPGTRLNQLRFRRTRGESPKPITAAEWKGLIEKEQVVSTQEDKQRVVENTAKLRFTIDLKGNSETNYLIGYRARKHTRRIDLEKRDYNPEDFWEPLYAQKNASLILDPDQFYILMTNEAVAVPPDYAAEMMPYDSRAGEFRVHYAGFFDPGFGWDAKTHKAGSSRGVLEVRSHEVPFLLEHGQTVGWLHYERMAERPETLYGQEINSNYQGQGLKLAKQFRSVS